MSVELIDHSAEIDRMISEAIVRGMTAVGLEAVGDVVDQMEKGYKDVHYRWKDGKKIPGSAHTNIRDTSALEGSINSQVEQNGNLTTATIGTNEDYALYVHEGTSKLKGRPFLRDGVEKNINDLVDTLKEYMSI